ncbi:MAG: gamma-glutamyl-gamma-aminobutyrate hydrolase family protein [Oscillospiraceae bacterium]
MKRVFVSQRVDIVEAYAERRDALDQNWAPFLLACGALLCAVPNHAATLAQLLLHARPHGIVLTGGNSPLLCGGNAPERDATDTALIAYAAENKTPLIGVCRGMQSIVTFFGGSLRPVQGHVAVSHPVAGGMARVVNSYHELAVDALPGVLKACAKSEDGLVEAVRHESLPILGIMWHPEREAAFNAQDIALFKEMFST